MHDWLFQSFVGWMLALLALLAWHAARSERAVDRILAVDTLSLVVIATLAATAIDRDEPAYLDVALVLALVAFVQTLAAANYIERRRLVP